MGEIILQKNHKCIAMSTSSVSILSKISSSLTSKEAVALVTMGAFVYGFVFGGITTTERVKVDDLEKTTISSTFLRSFDGILCSIGADFVMEFHPVLTPLLGVALLGSSAYYVFARPEQE